MITVLCETQHAYVLPTSRWLKRYHYCDEHLNPISKYIKYKNIWTHSAMAP